MKAKSPNIYVSMTRDGHYALETLLKKGKSVDEIISCSVDRAESVSDYVCFERLAEKFKLKLVYTEDINSLTEEFVLKKPNVIIVNGWSQLLDKELLKTAKNGCVGTHPALLPKNRGRAPIAWHFINEEKYGGITLFYLEATCDSGPIIDQIKFRIKDEDTASDYYHKIMKFGAALLLKNFDTIVDGSARRKAIPQDHAKATYLLKRRPRDSRIDFNDKNAREIHNLVRAVSDVYPLANFDYKGVKYLILNSVLPAGAPRHSGLPGQIAKVFSDRIWVLTKQEIIEFKSIMDENRNKISPLEVFKEGEVLNE